MLEVTRWLGGWNHKMAAAAPTSHPLGKVREWLSLDSQQMSLQFSWNLSGSQMYIPEPITVAQAMQYTDWPSFGYMLSLPTWAGEEPHPCLDWEWQRGASPHDKAEEEGRWMLGRQTSSLHASVSLFLPSLSCLLFNRRKLPVPMSCWMEGMLIPLTGEFCTQRAIYTLLNTTDEA